MGLVANGFSRSERVINRLFPGLSEESRIEIDATFEAIEGVGHAAVSGLALTSALAGLAVVSRGGRQALVELKHHVLYIHPLLWVLTLMCVCTILVFRDAKAMNKVRAVALDPILSFVVHVFGAAVGAVPVLGLCKLGGLLPTDPKAGLAVLAFVWLLSLIMAFMARIGLVSGSRRDLKVKEWVQVAAFFLLTIGILLLIALSEEGRPTDEGLPGFFETVVHRIRS